MPTRKPGTSNTLSGFNFNTQTSTPAYFPSKSSSFNFATTPGTPLVNMGGTMAKPQMTTGLVKSSTPPATAPKTQVSPPPPSGVSPTGHTTALPGQNGGQNYGDANANQNSTSAPTDQNQPLAFNPTFTGLVGQLGSYGAKDSDASNTALEAAKAAKARYEEAIANLTQVRKNEADSLARTGNSPIPLEFQQGRAAVLQGQYAALENAYGQEANAAAALFSPALNAAVTGQGQKISASQQAASLAAPQLSSYGQGYYNPLDTKGGAASGQYGTGPAAAANVGSIQDQTKLVNDWSAARQSAVNIGNQLIQFVQSNGVNPTDLNAVNKFLQAIGAQTSSPQYKQFYNLVTDLANTYAPVLGQGDASNYKVQLAQSLLDGTANGQTLPQILSGLDAQAQTKIAGVQSNIQRLNSGQNVNPEASSNSGASSGGDIWSW